MKTFLIEVTSWTGSIITHRVIVPHPNLESTDDLFEEIVIGQLIEADLFDPELDSYEVI